MQLARSDALRVHAARSVSRPASPCSSLGLTPCVSMKPAQSNPLETMQLAQSDALRVHEARSLARSDALRVHAARSVSRPACPCSSLGLTPCVSMKPAQSNPLETMQLAQSDALRVHEARSVQLS
ncbi:hypothetical protein NDU88_013134 [Pleurodeles waltl]|uniref:Uncharacterized protein n=1 Tax=Pleurodeles waltl TaxID=8319 RepID=A0AAV7R6D5_PLEWA|nr:hypothetical protein NDU88_013134 [Pleurodeles waltl]